MRIRLAVPNNLNRDEQAAALDAALESVTRAAQAQLARGMPTAAEAIRSGRVRWRPEPPGDEHFDLPSTVIKRGWGDCDDLAPWHAASLRMSGEDPEAIAFVRPSGPRRWHALVRRSNGKLEDPSKAAGMGGVHGDDYMAPFWNPMFDQRLALATYPLADPYGWAARADIPSVSVPASYSMLTRAPTPRSAVVGAIRGGCHLAHEDMRDIDALRLAGLHDLMTGVPPEVVGEAFEHAGGVGFLPMAAALAPAAMSLAKPLISKILPGGGGGGAAPAAPPPAAAAAAAPLPGGLPSGSTLHCPGGPIIVRF